MVTSILEVTVIKWRLTMERNLALEVVRVTEAAALFASRYAGRGDAVKAVNSSVEAMTKVFASVSVDGKVVIGKSDLGDSSLSANFNVGNNTGPLVDVVIDPLDGSMTCARGGQNSISAVAMGETRSFFYSADNVHGKDRGRQ